MGVRVHVCVFACACVYGWTVESLAALHPMVGMGEIEGGAKERCMSSKRCVCARARVRRRGYNRGSDVEKWCSARPISIPHPTTPHTHTHTHTHTNMRAHTHNPHLEHPFPTHTHTHTGVRHGGAPQARPRVQQRPAGAVLQARAAPLLPRKRGAAAAALQVGEAVVECVRVRVCVCARARARALLAPLSSSEQQPTPPMTDEV